MAGEPVVTIVGNLTADPVLRFTQSGTAVASFTVAQSSRSFDRVTGEWKDGEALFLSCTVWQAMAENAVNTLTRGVRVLLTGRLRQRWFETSAGEARSVVELEVDDIGPSLRYATATVTRVERQSREGMIDG